MTFRGHVKNGVVVLDENVKLDEGTPVRVQPLKKALGRKKAARPRALGERLMRFAGKARGLPRDMARNHDHYVHGTSCK